MPDFCTLIKPASSLCNLHCRYCFYADESSVRNVPSYGIISRETSHMIIDRAFEYTNRGIVGFAFQGGEPTLAGIDFFNDFISYVSVKKPSGISVNYSIQTNGILINDEWCRLFKKNSFLVGLSLDGNERSNDFCRVDFSGQGSYRRVIHSADLLLKYGIDFNILTVITKQIATRPKQLWDFYRKNRFSFVQLIPCLAPLEDENTIHDFTLAPRQYSSFLISLFELWADSLVKGEYISIRLFDNLVRMALGERPEMCGMLGSCSAQFVIEADGSVYPCDFYAIDKYNCGNIRNLSFNDIQNGEIIRAFLTDSCKTIPSLCSNCKFYGICGGGCHRYRSFYTSVIDFCPYAEFLEHSYRRISEIARLIYNLK